MSAGTNDIEVAVLADQEGNVYVIPKAVVERGRVPEEYKRPVLQRLNAWTPPQTIRPVRMLGWANIDRPATNPPQHQRELPSSFRFR